NDTAADAGGRRALATAVDDRSRFTLVTSRIVYMHDPDTIDSAGDGVLRWGGAFKRHHGEPASAALATQEVFGVCGAACLMPKAVFDELGGFDEDLFASHEDVAIATHEVLGACGAACLMPKAVFDELGGFDEDFFASHEDVDLSYRARLRGYRCRYVADAPVRHHGSATLGKARPLRA